MQVLESLFPGRLLVSAFYAVAGYQNDFDGNLYVDCYNNHQALYAVESYLNNHCMRIAVGTSCVRMLYPLHSPIVIGRDTRIGLTSPSRSRVMPIM